MSEVFLDEECAHSGRAGGVYHGTWFADRVAVRIFGSNHDELAGKWRRGEPQRSRADLEARAAAAAARLEAEYDHDRLKSPIANKGFAAP